MSQPRGNRLSTLTALLREWNRCLPDASVPALAQLLDITMVAAEKEANSRKPRPSRAKPTSKQLPPVDEANRALSPDDLRATRYFDLTVAFGVIGTQYTDEEAAFELQEALDSGEATLERKPHRYAADQAVEQMLRIFEALRGEPGRRRNFVEPQDIGGQYKRDYGPIAEFRRSLNNLYRGGIVTDDRVKAALAQQHPARSRSRSNKTQGE